MYTEKEAKEIWNNFADKYNQWDCLELFEKEEIMKNGLINNKYIDELKDGKL